MATSIPPEVQQNQNQNPPSPAIGNTNVDANGNPIVPTNAPNPVDTTRQFYESLIQDANRRATEAEQRLAAMGNQNTNINTPPANLDVIQDPNGFMNAIRQEFKQTVAPLDEFRLQFQRQNQYVNSKNTIKNHPNVSQYWHLLEPQLDSAYSNNQLQDTSIQGLLNACSTVMGYLAFNNPSILTQNQNNIPSNNNQTRTPPNIPSSTPPVPQNNTPTSQLRDLTETEERLRRSWNMTKEDFLKGQESDSIIITRKENK